MPPLFIRSFKSQHKCNSCSRLTSLSLCQFHLTKCRLAFRHHAAACRAAGKCVRCSRKAVNGWLRCAFHAAENRAQCRRWGQLFSKAKYAHLRDLGLCVHSPSHGPATHGTLCEVCRRDQDRYRRRRMGRK